MSFNVYMHEMEELFCQVYKAKQNNEFHNKIKNNLPKKFGNGYVSAAPLNNTLFTEQYFNFTKNLLVRGVGNHAKDDYCFLIFILEGENYFTIDNQKNSFNFLKNSVALGISKNEESYKIDMKNHKTWQYSYNLSKESLLEYLIEFDDAKLIKQVEEADQFELFRQIHLTPTHHYMIQKMLNNPYHGSLQKLYFETCASELFITLLKDLCTKKTYTMVLNEDDKDRLYKAKKILLQDIQNPPTITELTKMTALNKEKLTKGFKVLFGNTIFKTLTEHRMKVAYKHLQINDKNVSEVAFEAGYENVSNFITVFRKEFGKTPGEMRKEKSFYI